MVDAAIEVAEEAHRGQFRKGSGIPYISHPRAVARILSDAGCSEELVAAGILHDTVEDTSLTLDFIREKFGERVAKIVQGCSEPDKSLPWEQRKLHTVEFLKTAPLEVRTVTCADKLHNLLTIIADYEVMGDDVWDRFSRGRTRRNGITGSWRLVCAISRIVTGMERFLSSSGRVWRRFLAPRNHRNRKGI